MSSSTALLPDPESISRPRNRRFLNSGDNGALLTSTSSASSARGSPATSRRASPIPSAGIGRGSTSTKTTANNATTNKKGAGLLDGSWAPNWSSVQEFATSLIANTSNRDSAAAATDDINGIASGGSGSRSSRGRLARDSSGSSRNNKTTHNWGPAPPSQPKPSRLQDVAAGTLAKRDADLRARKTASVLESHPGVNGGLDVAGASKRRSSDDMDSRIAAPDQEAEEDHLVYIHHVQAIDNYAGIVLKYRCREDAFRKSNGLWARDNIQVRKWLAIPVDACEIKGRPCDPPSWYANTVDLLAPTPQPVAADVDDFFAASHGKGSDETEKPADEAPPWTHVRWVKLDFSPNPIEIGRLPRRTLGYFPPRRKRSIHHHHHATSSLAMSSTRQSLDADAETAVSDPIGSPRGSLSSRRQSSLASRSQVLGPNGSVGRTRSRGGSVGDDPRPVWMRRPGGVGTMGKNVRTPGPDKDYFNTWAKKHVPGLNIDDLPSMSVMGSESARFGFRGDASAIVESPFENGRDASAVNRQGNGLDKAAAAIETWLRGAFTKKPGTPLLLPRLGRAPDDNLADLIELEDTPSEDGRFFGGDGSMLLGSNTMGTTARSEGEGGVIRGRMQAVGGPSSVSKGKKGD